MIPEDARGYIDGLSFHSKQDVWGDFPHRYDHWDAFEAFETVANLRYEYAVQLNDHQDRGADWWYWKDNMRTQWFTDYEEAVNVAESIPERARVVRRLVGDVEVVA